MYKMKLIVLISFYTLINLIRAFFPYLVHAEAPSVMHGLVDASGVHKLERGLVFFMEVRILAASTKLRLVLV